ncbi:MAG: hypothetical protein PHU23_01130 [Dehalococcoidales bacterium]|nr:hypothetical protein [Dehalococcoidales bacterium]
MGKGIIVAGAFLGLLGIALLAKKTSASGGYACPYCEDTFNDLAALQIHVQTDHPGEIIPITIKWE